MDLDKDENDKFIFFGDRIFHNLGSFVDSRCYSKVFVVTNSLYKELYLDQLEKQVPVQVDHQIIEETFNPNKYESLFERLSEENYDKNSLLIALGDDVVQKVVSVLATNYLGGLPYLLMPIAIFLPIHCYIYHQEQTFFEERGYLDHLNYPQSVILDLDVSIRFPRSSRILSFARLIKYGLVFDKRLFHLLTSKDIENFSSQEILHIIEGGYRLEMKILKESKGNPGVRQGLNFGYVFFDVLSCLNQELRKNLSKGEMLSVAMMIEVEIARLSGLVPKVEAQVISEAFETAGLPTRLGRFTSDQIINKLILQYQNRYGEISLCLPKGIGKGVQKKIVSSSLVEQVVRSI